MLKLEVKGGELFDPVTDSFIITKGGVLTLEHSLVSLSKWESKWQIPFLATPNLTMEQTIDYIRCMTITQNVDPNLYHSITNSDIAKVKEYISNPMTATKINERNSPRKRDNKIVTSELIYYWMTALNIPFECQKWHLNRLLTLIRIASIEQDPDKQKNNKMPMREAMSQQHALNAMRRAKHRSKG